MLRKTYSVDGISSIKEQSLLHSKKSADATIDKSMSSKFKTQNDVSMEYVSKTCGKKRLLY